MPSFTFQTQFLSLSLVWSNNMSTFPKQQLVIGPILYHLGIKLSPSHAQFGVLGVYSNFLSSLPYILM